EELQEKVVEAYVHEVEGHEEKQVMGIYLTQFVMQ
ncbi:flagellar basal body protein FliL, partial [Kineococcus sp. T13]|nr:flagellar basal body protein FliL [Kineococcus vitellinus]NAZ78459.1 flagellar basal body protein FliL [Kineococcus vitellinus]